MTNRTARIAALAAIIIAAVMIGILALRVADHLEDRLIPTCPTEDSCMIDYREGAWHIEPTTP